MTWKFLSLGFPSRKHNPTIFGCKAKGMKWNLYNPALIQPENMRLHHDWHLMQSWIWDHGDLVCCTCSEGLEGHHICFPLPKCVALMLAWWMISSLCKHATSSKFQSQSEQNSIQFEEFKQTHWSSKDWEMLDSSNSIRHKIALQTHELFRSFLRQNLIFSLFGPFIRGYLRTQLPVLVKEIQIPFVGQVKGFGMSCWGWVSSTMISRCRCWGMNRKGGWKWWKGLGNICQHLPLDHDDWWWWWWWHWWAWQIWWILWWTWTWTNIWIFCSPPPCLTFLHPDAFYAFMCVHCVCKLCFCTYFSIVMYYTVLFYSIRCVPFSSIVLQVESRGDRKLKSMKYIYQKWMV